MHFHTRLLSLALLAWSVAASGQPSAGSGGGPGDEPAEPAEEESRQTTPASESPTTEQSAEPSAPPPPRPSDDAADEEPPLVAPATDTVSGHLQLSAQLGLAGTSGAPSTSGGDPVGGGGLFGAELAYGVARGVFLGATAEGWSLGGGPDCADCETTSFGAMALVRYHLVQGVRFDPHLLFGLGYRSLSVEGPSVASGRHGGPLFRVQVGGDWYASSIAGLGPFLAAEALPVRTVPTAAGDGRWVWCLLLGARATLDLPGK